MDSPEGDQPLVTFPDESTSPLELELHSPLDVAATSDGLALTNEQLNSLDTVKFEEKRMTSASKTKVVKDGFSSEQVI